MDDRAAPAAVDNDLFLRLCLRSRWRPDGLREAEKLAANGHVSWPDLCETARAGGLAPLLHDVLRSSRFVPETARRCLQDAYQETAIYAGLMSVELGRVLRRLEDAGLPAIVLKGAALGDTLYGNSALRPMTDLDLLLRERDIPVAIDLMTRSGYHTAGVEVRPGHMLAYENEVALRSPGTPALAVELHWHLLDSPFYQDQVDEGWFWDTAQPARVAETGALVLGLEGTFLHLSAHYVLHHKAHGTRWIYDLAGLAALHGEALDWQLLLDRAAAFKLVTSIQVVLQQLADDWNVELPPDVLRAAHALPVSDEERRVIQWLHADQRPVVQRFWADLASMSGWRQRLPFLLASLFPSPDYMEDRYELRGRVLLPLAYPYRWVSGLREFLASNGKDNG